MLYNSLHQWTPLHHAARGGYELTVEYLIDKGADINTKDNDEVFISLYTPWKYGCKLVAEICVGLAALKEPE